jgi:hypothetical protein
VGASIPANLLFVSAFSNRFPPSADWIATALLPKWLASDVLSIYLNGTKDEAELVAAAKAKNYPASLGKVAAPQRNASGQQLVDVMVGQPPRRLTASGASENPEQRPAFPIKGFQVAQRPLSRAFLAAQAARSPKKKISHTP